MRIERWILATLVAALAPVAAWADGDGLAARAESISWGGSLAPASRETLTPAWRATLLPASPGGLQVKSFNVLGDLYMGSSAVGLRAPPSGFRATSGLLVGSRSQPWGAAPVLPAGGPGLADRRLAGGVSTLPYTAGEAASENATVPYLGFGYSALSAKSGWSFSADLGVMSLNPGGALRLGRSSQGLDELVRDMRLSPVLQLGVSYSF